MSLTLVAVEGCWLGARARAAVGTEEIGSVYAPPQARRISNAAHDKAPTLLVETVTDIAHRPQVSGLLLHF